jgi:hypothetical protein
LVVTGSPVRGSHAGVIIMPVHRRTCAAGLAAVIAASVTGCARPAGTAAPGTASPAPSATTVAPGNSPSGLNTASPSTADTPVCQGSHLKIRMIYGGPAAGTVGGVISFTNEGSTACHMTGWPALIAFSPAGRATAERTLAVFAGPMLTSPPVVMIRPGARAVAVLAGHDEPGPGITKCPPAYRRLRVTPPGSTGATVISAWIPYYDAYLPACNPIQVSPLIPASALPFLRLHHA